MDDQPCTPWRNNPHLGVAGSPTLSWRFAQHLLWSSNWHGAVISGTQNLIDVVDDLPVVRAALDAGEVCLDQAIAVARPAARLRPDLRRALNLALHEEESWTRWDPQLIDANVARLLDELDPARFLVTVDAASDDPKSGVARGPQLAAGLLWILDGRCRMPGCSNPIRDVHHLIHREHGGTDDHHNLAGLCGRCHHRVLHRHGWHRPRRPQRQPHPPTRRPHDHQPAPTSTRPTGPEAQPTRR